MKNLRELRTRKNYTQAALAERMGTTQQTIGRWETGKSEPNLATARDLAVILRTTVDALLGREAVLEHQTVDPLAWLRRDDDGYWGNIGIRVKASSHSTWYPITTATMKRLHGAMQTVEAADWICFQTLNNKLVAFRPAAAEVVTFLDEADDAVDGDWNCGPGDVEGWPMEIYECLAAIMDAEISPDDFSPCLVETVEAIIRENELDDERISDLCIRTRVRFAEGGERRLTCSPPILADALQTLEGAKTVDEAMLILDDNYGGRDIFISLSLVSLIELPLLVLRKGLEEQMSEWREAGPS